MIFKPQACFGRFLRFRPSRSEPPQNAWFYKDSLHFKRFCTYLRISARICMHLHDVCAYLLHDFRGFARICTYFHGFARIWTYLRVFAKKVVNYVKNVPKRVPKRPPNRQKMIPKSSLGGSRDGVWLCARFAWFWDQFWASFFLTKIHQKSMNKTVPKKYAKIRQKWNPKSTKNAWNDW